MKQYRKLFFGLSVLLLLFGGYKLYRYLRYDRYTFFQAPIYIANHAFTNDGQTLVVNWQNEDKDLKNYPTKGVEYDGRGYDGVLAGKRFVSVESFKLKGDSNADAFTRTTPDWGEYWTISVYDTQDPELKRKDYDLFVAVRKYNTNRIPIFDPNSDIYIHEGREYRSILLKYIKESPTTTTEEALLDLETGELIKKPSGAKPIRQTELPKEATSFWKTEPGEYFEINKKGYYTFEDGSVALDASMLWRLNNDVEAYKLIVEKTTDWIILSDQRNLELVIDTYNLLYPEDQSIYQNLIINPDYSIDGQVHKVNNYDEFIKYYKYAKEEY